MDGPGRPSLYEPEFAEQAFELCLAGATNRDLADTFEVGHSTIDNWLQKHPEFAQSVKRGRGLADGRVAHGLYSRAIGYTYETTRVLLHRGELITVPHTVHKPPDVRACTFWLRNRRPQQWRDGPKPPQDEGPDLSAALNEAFERARLAGEAEAGGPASMESASTAQQAGGPSPGQRLAEPDRSLRPDGEGDARMVVRQAVADDGGGARGGHQEGHGEGRVAGHAAHHEARADDADADAVLLQHVADAFAPHADGGLAGVVGRRVGQGDEARERGDDGDLAALAGDHAGEQRLDGVEHAADIDVERLADHREIVERGIVLVDRDAGVGDHEIDRMGVVEAREPTGEPLAVDDVDRIGDDRGALGATRGGDGLEAARVAAGQRERHAGSGIVERQRLADAARGAGDDDAGELLHGITFGRGALYALEADTRVPRRGAASGVQWS